MTLAIKLFSVLLNIIYFFFKLFPTGKKVTMLSRQSDTPSKEFLMIEEKLREKDNAVKVVKLCRTLDGGIASSLTNKFKYGLHMFTQMYNIATSQVILLDSYCIAASLLKHKKSLTVIQMWHSMGTMKKFGYTSLDSEEGTKSEIARAMTMHENYDYVFASAEAYKEHLAKGFNVDINKIVTMPLPRLDMLKSDDYKRKTKNAIYEIYPELKEKPVILYCPTFRKDEGEFQLALNKLINCVDFSKYNFVVKLHPLSKIALNDKIIQAEEFSSFDLFFVSDYVISDYSCIVYEAAVLNLPIYFYNFDMGRYLKNRGLAIDYYKELPGIISPEPKEITEAIESGKYDMKRLASFRDKYIRDTASATGDIADFILKFVK